MSTSTSKQRFARQRTSRDVSASRSRIGASRISSKRSPGSTATRSAVPDVRLNGDVVTPQSLLQTANRGAAELIAEEDGAAETKGGAEHQPAVSEFGARTSAAPDGHLGAFVENAPSIRAPPVQPDAAADDAANMAKRLAARNEKQEEEQPVRVTLGETPTEILFCLWGSSLPQDDMRSQAVTARVTAYEATQSGKLAAADRYITHGAQTLNYPQKSKEVMEAPNPSRDVGCGAASFEISDALGRSAVADDADGETHYEQAPVIGKTDQGVELLGTRNATNPLQQFVDETVSVALAAPTCLVDVDGNASSSATRKGVASGTSEGGAGAEASADGEQQEQEDVGAVNAATVLFQQKTDELLENPRLLTSLDLMGRAVQQNVYHSKHLLYRSLPVTSQYTGKHLRVLSSANADDPLARMRRNSAFGLGSLPEMGKDGQPVTGGEAESTVEGNESDSSTSTASESDAEEGSLEGGGDGEDDEAKYELPAGVTELWSFGCGLTRGRGVTAMAWNHANPDVLAVGYGAHSLAQDGQVLFWSLRNPQHPEKRLRIAHPVTSLEFSRMTPNLLAVGTANGAISVFDVRRESSTDLAFPDVPLVESSSEPGGHTDPVWQVRWVDRGQDRGESLVSIATDGKVLEWNIQKGLSMAPLMQLKRHNASEGVISRQAGGFCFDFPLSDSSAYIVGTEQGYLHRCSVSYTEQYLETYTGHSGPVYSLSFSPFWGEAFATCSADWTVNLWNMNELSPALCLHSTDQAMAINDVTWSPTRSTVLASVTQDAKIQIWDVSRSTIDPVFTIWTRDMEDDKADEATEVVEEEEAEEDLLLTFDPIGSPPRDAKTGTKGAEDGANNEEAADGEAAPAIRMMQAMETQAKERRELVCAVFAENAPILAVGDNRGDVKMYRIGKSALDLTPSVVYGPTEQIQQLRQAMYPDGAQQKKTSEASTATAAGATI